MKLKLLALALIGSFAFTSCEKEEEKKVPKVTPSKKEVVDEFESLEDLLASQDTVTLIQKKGNKVYRKLRFVVILELNSWTVKYIYCDATAEANVFMDHT